VQAGEGRMMMRMIVVQVLQGQVMKRKNFNIFTKIMTLFVIFLGLLAYDFHNFY